MNPSSSISRYAFIFGRGRSGTTWIGQILNHYMHCHYKYEPFHTGKRGGFTKWLADLAFEDDQLLRKQFAAYCANCIHDIEYPPFVTKPSRPQPGALLRLSWQLGKIFPFTRKLYEGYARPRLSPSDWVLIKQVNFPNELLYRLVQVLSPAVIAVLRNPFASVASAMRFYHVNPEEPFRTTNCINRVLELLPSVATYGIQQYTRTQLESLSDAAFEAVRWRMQTEPLADFAERYEHGMSVTHEEFAADPVKGARQLFDFLGWEYGQHVTNYVHETIAGECHELGASERRKLHGIHRDPIYATQRWRRDLSDKQYDDIRRVIDGSSLVDRWASVDAIDMADSLMTHHNVT